MKDNIKIKNLGEAFNNMDELLHEENLEKLKDWTISYKFRNGLETFPMIRIPYLKEILPHIPSDGKFHNIVITGSLNQKHSFFIDGKEIKREIASYTVWDSKLNNAEIIKLHVKDQNV